MHKERSCNRYKCPFGKQCEVKAEQCQTKSCTKQPKCVPVKAFCPNGTEPLWHSSDGSSTRNGLPAICVPMSEEQHQNTTGRRFPGSNIVSNKSYCPPTHYCYFQPGQTIGVCCSHNNKTTQSSINKLGLCPEFHNNYKYRYGQKCNFDSECPHQQKCCRIGKTDVHVCRRAVVNYNSPCQKAVQRSLNIVSLSFNYMPWCHAEGKWKRIQCHDSIGMCWCVDEQTGEPVPNTRIRGTPDCTIDYRLLRKMPICPSKLPIRRCFPWLCYLKTCPAYPKASCRINPCGNCSVQFYDEKNNILDCFKGISNCEKERAIRIHKHFIEYVRDRVFNRYIRLVHTGLLEEHESYKEWQNSTVPSGKKWMELYKKYKTNTSGPGQCSDKMMFSDDLKCPSDQSINKIWKYFYNKESDRCEYTLTSNCALQEPGGFLLSTQCEFQCSEKFNQMAGIFVPACDPNLEHSYQASQCHDGFCFCMNTTTGEPIKSSLTRGIITCDNKGHNVNKSDKAYICTDGSEPTICEQTCASTCDPSLPQLIQKHNYYQYNKAIQCIPDHCNKCHLKQAINRLCNDTQSEECFIEPEIKNFCDDSHGRHPRYDNIYHSPGILNGNQAYMYNSSLQTCTKVDISGKCYWKAREQIPGLFATKYQCVSLCDSIMFCDDGADPAICGDVCQNMTCKYHFAAVCHADPCTCQPQFVNYNGDIMEDCNRNDTVCEVMRRDALARQRPTKDIKGTNIYPHDHILSHSKEISNLQDTDYWESVIPDCDWLSGAYMPLQCGKRRCFCVYEDGQLINTTFRLQGDTALYYYCETLRMEHVVKTVYLRGATRNVLKNENKFIQEIQSKVYDWIGTTNRLIVNIQVWQSENLIEVKIGLFGKSKKEMAEAFNELEEMFNGFQLRFLKRTYRVIQNRQITTAATTTSRRFPKSTRKPTTKNNKIVFTLTSFFESTTTAFYKTPLEITTQPSVRYTKNSTSDQYSSSTNQIPVTNTSKPPLMNPRSGYMKQKRIYIAIGGVSSVLLIGFIMLGIYCWRRKVSLGKRRDGALMFDNRGYDPSDTVEIASANTGVSSI